MKKQIPLLIMLLFAFSTSAQIAYTYHQNQIILNLKGMSSQEIEALRSEFEADELWVSPISQTRCWNFSSFPEVHEIEIDGETIYLQDILEASELVKSRTSGGTSGVSISLNPLPKYSIAATGPTNAYFNPNLFVESGTNEVVLAILDSGITNNVDDSQGYSYDPLIVNNENYVLGSPVSDENGHGTHIAGIANYISTNTSPGEELIHMDVRKILNEDNKGDLGAYLLANEDAIVAGAQILNLSLSFPEVEGNFFVNLLVRHLEEYNILGVVAAGNDALDLSNQGLLATPHEKNIFPAALQSPNLITVASINDKFRLSSFSNYGFYNVDVAVPGEMVAGYNIDSQFLGMSGTSQATAIVSGIAANLATYQQSFDGAALKCAIMEGVDHIEGLIGKVVSEGVVNAQTSLSILQAQTGCANDSDADRIALPTKIDSKVYPNPFHSELHMQLEEGTNEITISDMFGKVLYSTTLEVPRGGMPHYTNEVQTFPSGIYMLTVNNHLLGEKLTTKLVKN